MTISATTGELTSRQRILAALNHRMGDRLAWAPYFRTWWESHQKAGNVPAFLQGAGSYLEAFSYMDLDILDKGAAAAREVYEGVETVEEELPSGCIKTRYMTPVGEVYSIQERTSAYDDTLYKTSYPFKSMADYPVIMHLLEVMHYEPSYEEYEERQSQAGNDGQYMSEVPSTPLHRLFINWMGYQDTCFALADYPDEMDQLMGLIFERNQEALEIAMRSPAPIILTPGCTNADFDTPRLYQRYAMPHLKMVSERCHAAGKRHVAHMCGKLKPLLPLIAEAGLDGIESLTPPPYADTYLWEAREALPGVCIIGGVSPHLLVGHWTRHEIEDYLRELFRRMAPGDDFILAVSDDTPCDAEIERFIWIRELLDECGQLPLAS